MSDQKHNPVDRWEADKLSDHIVETHHRYVRDAVPSIQACARKAVEKHGAAHPELKQIAETFDTMAKALEEHMAGEEKYLFPFVKKMLTAKRDGGKLPRPGFGKLEVPLKHHYEDHDAAAKAMQQIHELSNGYQQAQDAGATVTDLYKHLRTFEADLKEHIRVENEVLFGKSLELEKEVIGE